MALELTSPYCTDIAAPRQKPVERKNEVGEPREQVKANAGCSTSAMEEVMPDEEKLSPGITPVVISSAPDFEMIAALTH